MIIINKIVFRVLLIVKITRKSNNKTFKKSIISEKNINKKKSVINYIFKIRKFYRFYLDSKFSFIYISNYLSNYNLLAIILREIKYF